LPELLLGGGEYQHLAALAVDGQRGVAELDVLSCAEQVKVSVFLLVDGLIYGSHLGVQDTAKRELIVSPHGVAAVAVDAAVTGDLVGGGIKAECNLRPGDDRLKVGGVPIGYQHPRCIGQIVGTGIGGLRRTTATRQEGQDGGCCQ